MTYKHAKWDLPQMQSLPLDVKVRMSQQRIRSWYEYFNGNVYVSISGGKDSQVLAHIVKEMYNDVPLVFVNTGLEYDSVREKGYELADEVLKPQKSFLQILIQYGYPIISKEVSQSIYEIKNCNDVYGKLYQKRMRRFNGEELDKDGNKSAYNMDKYKFLLNAPFRISSKCCDYSKKLPAKKYEKQTGRKPYIGTLAEESRLRKTKWFKYGCNAFEQKRPTSQPLSFWTEQDILQYINKYSLDIADIYGDIVYTDQYGYTYDNTFFISDMLLSTTGAPRTGCIFCLFGISQDNERLLRLKEVEPQKYDYVMRGGKFDDVGMWIPDKGLGYKFVIDWINENGNIDIKY